MRQINVNLSGKITAPPVYLIDNGHRYTFFVESPYRAYVQIPDEEPHPYGSHILWADKVVHLLTPPPGFVGELTNPALQCFPYTEVLQYPPALERLTIAGRRFLGANGKPYQRKGMTGFCDLVLFAQGNLSQLGRVWGQAKDVGANERRVFGEMHFITPFGPHTMGDAAWRDAVWRFHDHALTEDMRIAFNVFQDEQQIGHSSTWMLDTWAWCVSQWQARGYAGVHPLSVGNERSKNGTGGIVFPAPPFWASAGSEVADTAPPMPGWGEREWHGRRDDPKFQESASDMGYVSMGMRYLEEQGRWERYAPEAPAHHSEPLGAAEIIIPGRRHTDPDVFRRQALDALAHGCAYTFHAEDPIYSRPMGPIQQTCARAAFEVLS